MVVCTVKDPDYEDCFGFTEEEVRDLLEYCGVPFTGEVKEMYDGYQIGMTELYNPWSHILLCRETETGVLLGGIRARTVSSKMQWNRGTTHSSGTIIL